ncbi:peptide MFS transporter [Novosphingobium flavum]|uniref:Peptide MFS transporter n=1 Tax=Novosphingobium aerophilum TaxID=2839843 RepID=A0A7X1FAJ9_9SPHN|nr:peptide MFS transporter [Novosphingobium aerophilum]MBC2653453.1 peptide MFS transporter [Novosphingobium aerophilum]MBC2662354.1 peptide MFS transporter [Novosphingobium aerophilum]
MKDIASWNEGDWIGAIAALALFAFLVIGGLIAARKSEEVVGHPRGLFVLFYAEMWERFSYYGMRALLVLYLTKFWLFQDGKANLIYGAYTSLVYITPVLGGAIADRYLGQRKAVIYGGILLAFGHLFMAVEGMHGVTDPAIKQADPAINVFWLALALICVGSGFLKANISVIVGQLYRMTDTRRDAAYTIFYMGVNVGAAMGTILVGYLGETIGWAWGFGLAGIGMVMGLLIFMIGKPALNGQGEPPAPLAKRTEWTLYGTGIAAVAVIWALVQYQDVIQSLLIVSGLAMLGYTLYEAFKLPKEPRERIFAILFLVALNPIFWGLFEQAGGSLSLYTDRFVDRAGVPTSLFQSINPIYIVLLGPVFAGLWTWLGHKGLEPSAPAKFGLALVQVGLSFLVFVWGAQSVGPALTPVIFVFLIYLLQTTGELCLSPVGLSAMTRLAPVHLGSFIMGAWFYMTAVGNFVAGKIGEATGGEGGEMSKELTLAIYSKIGWITIGVALVVLVLARIVRGWMHLDTLEDRSAPTVH